MIKKLDISVTCWYNTAFRACQGLSGTDMFILLNILPIGDSLNKQMPKNLKVLSFYALTGCSKGQL
ncbi:MAG: hypothetical protein A2Y03_08700 [Omnitrophica WOR_2 bacterium GWF2_38_59]|nr:MAG: hypothetical protein A2Y03_08700 [Omnitrophica WOR_2 bacterium GWF2_38_59]OGX50962.1 MAG: hypothetical protein A2267_00290 [Omnitrophica WOR_2 bacterium RIFOXYA12_FULL_38_10]OGX55457.1 MAG: hypothetical protein A2306_06250 [Omnitrophica WOR_2 bacterium RIFOXYB2_FULL_38_16]OGX56751.1 MAG: hypothetical protein A2447_00915 [Omnitrophica WOR_2 bacterium RIFOXYC2_FULL_38_12]HBG62382.1 hypothetical protein [Candidatus Omnitrophota bacterium]